MLTFDGSTKFAISQKLVWSAHFGFVFINHKMSTIDGIDDIVDVSSEDDETQSLNDVINRMITKLDNCPPEQLSKLEKVNESVIKQCAESTNDSN